MRSLLAVSSLTLACTFAIAQANSTASIAGTVVDSSMAAVLGAQITATDLGTGELRTTRTSAKGEYRLDQLSVGAYSIKVTQPGFATATRNQVELVVDHTTLADFTLQPGSVTETVNVSAIGSILDLQKTDVSASFSQNEIQNLPLNGRDFANLAYLAPGARPTDSYDPTKNRVAVFSVNGGSGRNVNATVNGVDNKDNTVGGPVMQFPLGAIQEFNISTQRFSAVNGRSEGAAINVITKSGTAQYHGSLYLYDTETALNAIDVFTSEGGGQKHEFSRQQFGGAFGGPVVKDRDFVFLALERQREHTALAVNPNSYDELVLAEPLGAKPGRAIPTPYFDWRYTGRWDHRFSNKNSAYFTYSDQNNNGLNDQANNQSDLTAGNTTTNQLILANLTWNSVLNDHLVNSVLAGYQFWNNKILATVFTPAFAFPDGTNFGTNGNVPQQSYQKKWQFKDDLSWSTGNHGLHMGVDYVYEPVLGGFYASTTTLNVRFSDAPQVLLEQRCGFSCPGAVTSMAYANGDPSIDLKNGARMLGLYFQDDWRVSQRLTLALGLRWDKDFNLVGGSDQATNRTYLQFKAISSPYAGIPHDDNLDFSPRLGFAWDITGNSKHILRGGYGLYYGQIFENVPTFMIRQSNPTLYAGFYVNNPMQLVPGTNILLGDYRWGVDPLPTFPPPLTDFSQSAPGTVTGWIMDPHYRNPVSEQFNLGYTWEVTPNSVLELDFVHELALHESKMVDINPLAPGTGAHVLDATFAAAGLPLLGHILDAQSIDRSRYDGLNLSYRRRMTNHFTIDSSYVLSRAVCYDCYGGTASFFNNATHPYQQFAKSDFGFAPADERHRFVFSGIVDIGRGFELASILQWASSRPYSASTVVDALGYGSVGRAVVPVSNLYDFSTYAFTSASEDRAAIAAGAATLAPFNSLRGSPFFQLDMRVAKRFKFGERYALEFISQFFDLTNRANYGGDYVGNVADPRFRQPAGYITPSGVILPQSFRAELGAEFRF